MLTALASVRAFTCFLFVCFCFCFCLAWLATTSLKMYLSTFTVPHFLKCLLAIQWSFSDINLTSSSYFETHWFRLTENKIQRFCVQDSWSGSCFPLWPHHFLLLLVSSILNTSLALHVTPSRGPPKSVKCLFHSVTTPHCSHFCSSTYDIVVIWFVSGQMYWFYSKNLINICLLT